LKSQKLGIVAL